MPKSRVRVELPSSVFPSNYDDGTDLIAVIEKARGAYQTLYDEYKRLQSGEITTLFAAAVRDRLQRGSFVEHSQTAAVERLLQFLDTATDFEFALKNEQKHMQWLGFIEVLYGELDVPVDAETGIFVREKMGDHSSFVDKLLEYTTPAFRAFSDISEPFHGPNGPGHRDSGRRWISIRDFGGSGDEEARNFCFDQIIEAVSWDVIDYREKE